MLSSTIGAAKVLVSVAFTLEVSYRVVLVVWPVWYAAFGSFVLLCFMRTGWRHSWKTFLETFLTAAQEELRGIWGDWSAAPKSCVTAHARSWRGQAVDMYRATSALAGYPLYGLFSPHFWNTFLLSPARIWRQAGSILGKKAGVFVRTLDPRVLRRGILGTVAPAVSVMVGSRRA